MTVNYLYRVVETTYSGGIDENGEPVPGGPTRPNLVMVPVLRETPRGWWVPEDRCGRAGAWRWVSKDRTIPYACLTVEEAVEAWRKRIRFRILRARKLIERLTEADMRMQNQGFYADHRRWTDPAKPDLLVRAARGEFKELAS